MHYFLLLFFFNFFMLISAEAEEKKISYEKDLLPLFKESCFSCHGPKKQKGGLRLDSIEHVNSGGESGAIAIAGSPENSTLYMLTILPEEDDDVMPAKGDHLTQKQTELIRLWIKQGALFEDGSSIKKNKKEIVEDNRMTELDQLSLTVPAPDAMVLESFKKMGVKINFLSKNKHLIALDFGRLNKSIVLKDENLNALTQLSQQLISLDFAHVIMVGKKFNFFKSLNKLKILHLENSGIGDKVLTDVANLSELEYLNLYGTFVTDEGLKSLKTLKKLKALYLWKSKVTEEGVKKLKEVLPYCKITK